jgi:hypothetical protein
VPQFDWDRELESHWALFKDAGWVERVTVEAVDVDSGTVTATVTDVEAMRDGEGIRKTEVTTPEGGLAFVATLGWHLRVSTLGGIDVRKRFRITDGDGEVWVVDDPDLAADGNEVACRGVRA